MEWQPKWDLQPGEDPENYKERLSGDAEYQAYLDSKLTVSWKEEWNRKPNEDFGQRLWRVCDDPDYLKYVAEQAERSHFAMGLPVYKGDRTGIYEIWPDGRKVCLKKY